MANDNADLQKKAAPAGRGLQGRQQWLSTGRLPKRYTSEKKNFQQDWRVLYGDYLGDTNWQAGPHVQDFSEGGSAWPLPPMSPLPPQ